MTKAKRTPYTCPVCDQEKHELMIIIEPLDYGDVKVILKPTMAVKGELNLEFDIIESNFYYCPNCNMRFSRIDPYVFAQYKEKRIPGIFTDCILKECREKDGGRMGTYRNVKVGEIYMKGEGPRLAQRRTRVRELLEKSKMDEIPDAIDNFLQEFIGEYTLDQAGVCNECGIVVAREADMK